MEETPLSPDRVGGALSALIRELARPPEKPDPASPAPWAEILRPGAVVGRFELVRELGRGGFGVVWEARDTELGRAVALKAVRPGPRADLVGERLLREAEAAARLAHPNIVTLHDAGRTEHGPYLVLELLRGESLARRLARGPLAADEAVAVAVEVAKALAHAHAAGVVHRDLKPANVFLCVGGTVKVLDLGMAHAFGHPKLGGGTPGYMAPEQQRDAPEDERTDVFALGVMLHQMLTGELPFPEGAGAGRGRRAAPRLEVPGAPGLGPLLSSMLAWDPAMRIRDGEAALSALARVAAGLARAAPAQPRPAVARRPAVRGRQRRASIAVLPFADLSPERDQGYFADGIAEEILAELAEVDGLQVAGRTSSFAFKGTSRSLSQIGRELRVGAVLEGSVRKSGDRIRVTAKLVKTRDGFELWSRTFDRDLADVFAVQDEIAGAVAEALRVKLLTAPRERPGVVTASKEAYDRYLLGRDLLRTEETGQVKRALEAFEEATRLDPGFSRAWVGVALSLLFLEGLGGEGSSPVQRRRALDAAERAIALAPELPEGYAVRSQIRTAFLLDWKGALLDADRAQALGPGDALTCAYRGKLLTELGRLEEAVAVLEAAAAADPLSARAWTWLGRALASAGQHERGRAALARAIELSPRGDLARGYLVPVLLGRGRPAEALAVAEQATWPWVRLTGLAVARHALGQAPESQAALDELVAVNADDGAYQIAEVHAFRGELDRAFEWLQRARAQADTGLGWIKFDPLLEGLRGDPRYVALLRKLDLPLD